MKTVGGTIYVTINGVQVRAKGNWTYNLGLPMKEPVEHHGFTSTERMSKLEGVITDSVDTDVAALQKLEDASIHLQLASGKSVIFRKASFTGDGDITTEAGEIAVQFHGAPYAEED